MQAPVLPAGSDPVALVDELERGGIVTFPAPPGLLSAADREALLGQRQGGSRFHKNVSYRPRSGELRGLADPEQRARMAAIMAAWCHQATAVLGAIAPRYADAWSLDYASFRPIEEEDRELPLVRRNDLLHVDSFPTRPTQGRRILRIFLNLSPEQPRIWRTGPAFGPLAARYAAAAGIAASGSALARLRDAVGRAGVQLLPGLGQRRRSAYDRFMLRFHDFLKRETSFQEDRAQQRDWSFAPGACWAVFTDAVPHAVFSGRFALEQTVLLPVAAMATPALAPIRILEALAGRPLG